MIQADCKTSLSIWTRRGPHDQEMTSLWHSVAARSHLCHPTTSSQIRIIAHDGQPSCLLHSWLDLQYLSLIDLGQLWCCYCQVAMLVLEEMSISIDLSLNPSVLRVLSPSTKKLQNLLKLQLRADCNLQHPVHDHLAFPILWSAWASVIVQGRFRPLLLSKCWFIYLDSWNHHDMQDQVHWSGHFQCAYLLFYSINWSILVNAHGPTGFEGSF